MLVAASAAATTQKCNSDNCLRALRRFSKAAVPFCQTYIKVPTITVTVPAIATVTPSVTALPKRAAPAVPSFVASFPASRISSGCSCLNVPPVTTSVYASVTTTTTITATSTTPTAGPSCSPIFTLVGASESSFNPKNTAFSIKLPCDILNAGNYTVFANGNPVTTTGTANSITLPGFQDDYVFLAIAAFDIYGHPFFQSFRMLFGSISMPVLVLGPDGLPAPNVLVKANATTYPGIGQSGLTDATGKFIINNLPSTTIGLLAQSNNNTIGVNGVAATPGQITLQLTPFNVPNDFFNLDFSNGTAGWSAGTLIDHVETKKRVVDKDLVLSTGGSPSLQSTSSTWKTYPFSKTAYIRYRFITSEVPGGYFGTQYNDYFRVTIRADTGAFATVTHSMNELGLGAFDSIGATQWYTLQLQIPKAKAIQFDVAVSNVADALLDSQVVVDQAGDLTCDQCGDCTQCPGDPMCQASCTNPAPMTCSFYSNCAEAEVPDCDNGYALNYGQKNCLKFQSNLNLFSAAGQAFIWNTMHCLQLALIPALNCDATCASVRSAAFASHPACYVASGFCDLDPFDYLALFWTIWPDLFSAESGQQVKDTMAGCAGLIAQRIETRIEELTASVVDAVVNAAKAAALKAVRQFFLDLTVPKPVT
ncbi:hypothetical protein MMC30_008499 [Trapelia coarctata]|nr:hypothetical protein [Trapelia coarctata]